MGTHNFLLVSLCYGIGGTLTCLRTSPTLFRSWVISFLRASAQLVGLAFAFNFFQNSSLFPVFWIFLMVMIGVSTHTLLDRNRLKYRRMRLDAIHVLCLITGGMILPAVFLGIESSDRQSLTQTIPWIGILLGNALSGITLGIANWIQSISQSETLIEQKLAWGTPTDQVIRPFRSNALKTAMTPVLNSMAISGIVNIPGVMTGQLIAGVSPWIAVEAQIAILVLVSVGVFAGTFLFLKLSQRVLFTECHQLRKGSFTEA